MASCVDVTEPLRKYFTGDLTYSKPSSFELNDSELPCLRTCHHCPRSTLSTWIRFSWTRTPTMAPKALGRLRETDLAETGLGEAGDLQRSWGWNPRTMSRATVPLVWKDLDDKFCCSSTAITPACCCLLFFPLSEFDLLFQTFAKTDQWVGHKIPFSSKKHREKEIRWTSKTEKESFWPLPRAFHSYFSRFQSEKRRKRLAKRRQRKIRRRRRRG